MTRRRFYVPRDSIRDRSAFLPSDQAHHLRDVLRMATGDVVEIFDGEGIGYFGEVELQDGEVVIRNLQSLPHGQLHAPLILAAALIKSAKFEWILQKATELGIDEIIPLETRLSDIQIPESRIDSRLERWNRIVREASKQCGRFAAPLVHKPLSFSHFLCHEEFSSCSRLLFYEKSVELWRSDKIVLSGRIALCVGPEGGWDGSEIEQAGKAGCRIFSLGPWTLRAETAAIAAISIIQHQLILQRACLEPSSL
jgi:16S rRNA (uracil1498-N3)-methyltransferase